MRDYRQLRVWQQAHAMTVSIYRVTERFPKQEMYGLTSQMRRASASIGANLAERCGRASAADFGRFVQIAIGSSTELDYHLLLSRDLGFLLDKDFETLLSEVTSIRKMLMSLQQKVKLQSGGSGYPQPSAESH